MTGPEHYREAERLIRLADRIAEVDGDDSRTLAGAQVHATLALAAATAFPVDALHAPFRADWVKAVNAS